MFSADCCCTRRACLRSCKILQLGVPCQRAQGIILVSHQLASDQQRTLLHQGTGGDPDSEPSFEPGHVSVRGIPSEVWFRKLQNKATNSSFEVSFFFPVNEWLVARENYHRCGTVTVLQIEVQSTHW